MRMALNIMHQSKTMNMLLYMKLKPRNDNLFIFHHTFEAILTHQHMNHLSPCGPLRLYNCEKDGKRPLLVHANYLIKDLYTLWLNCRGCLESMALPSIIQYDENNLIITLNWF